MAHNYKNFNITISETGNNSNIKLNIQLRPKITTAHTAYNKAFNSIKIPR